MKRVVLLLMVLSTSGFAEEKQQKMSELDVVKLDAALAHEEMIRAQAQQAAATYEKTIVDICKKYGKDRNELGRGWGVDMTTGQIQIAAKPNPPKDAKPAPAPAKK